MVDDAVELNFHNRTTINAVSRGIGSELRRTREALGLSRATLVGRLPSGIGERTVLSYEHGARQLTVVRFVELSEALEVGAPVLLGQALQRAQVALQNMALQVDLHQLLGTSDARIRPLHLWARNRMQDSENGVVEVQPPGVRELPRPWASPTTT